MALLLANQWDCVEATLGGVALPGPYEPCRAARLIERAAKNQNGKITNRVIFILFR